MKNLLPSNESFLLINSRLTTGFDENALLENPAWITTMVLLIAGLIWFYIITNTRNQQNALIEQLRIKISSDLHDEVGSILSGLAMQSEILEVQATATDQKEKLQRIAMLSRNAMASMRDTVWALDARKDNWGSLLDRLYEHADETLSVKNIGFKIDLDGVQPQKELPLALRQNIYLIAKEAITNAAKYSNGDQMSIRIVENKNEINVQIQDNGEVDKNSIKTSGLGLSNMQLRAQKIGGSLSIDIHAGFAINLTCLNLNPHSPIKPPALCRNNARPWVTSGSAGKVVFIH